MLDGPPSKSNCDHWRAGCGETRTPRSGTGRRKRTPTRGTSPAAEFTLRGPEHGNVLRLPDTLTAVRTGVAVGGGGRGSTPSRRAGCGAVSPAAPRRPERALEVAPQWWRPRPPPISPRPSCAPLFGRRAGWAARRRPLSGRRSRPVLRDHVRRPRRRAASTRRPYRVGRGATGVRRAARACAACAPPGRAGRRRSPP